MKTLVKWFVILSVVPVLLYLVFGDKNTKPIPISQASAPAQAVPSSEAPAVSKASMEEVDKLTLAYLNSKVFPSGAVVCKSEVLDGHVFIGCKNRQLGSESAVRLWVLKEGEYLAVNGSARQDLERLPSVGHLKEMPLPLPASINIEEALKATA